MGRTTTRMVSPTLSETSLFPSSTGTSRTTLLATRLPTPPSSQPSQARNTTSPGLPPSTTSTSDSNTATPLSLPFFWLSSHKELTRQSMAAMPLFSQSLTIGIERPPETPDMTTLLKRLERKHH